ncbi:hypothetical protein CI109_105066 [Kwoniella shandongensis]|uniref:ubiquitinyl hydrolase 1 n=1 Tax=Kwoniella shandongensis TaxID=1734106 RepID=A0A5M6BWR2_9TREE|nr:uncharacterized protein CI109_004334 [Kwoniella shandongensis]KAA5527274.1 hypothetical protein CI109_004334 [Kwoniella shandongensis]
MSRSLPPTPLSNLPLSELQSLANELDSPLSRSPKEWFDRARHETDLAILAERKGKKEDMFVAYTRALACYTHCRMHPDFGDMKKKDQHWATRVKEFKETYDVFLTKAKEIKEQLKLRDVEQGSSQSSSRPGPSRQPSGPEVTSMGSIADRMKALGGLGMDVGRSSKRFSKDLSGHGGGGSVAGRSSAATGGGTGVTSLRTTGRQRSGSGSSTKAVVSPTTPVEKPTNSVSNNKLPPPKEEKPMAPFVRETATGSSTRSRRSTNASETDRPLPTPTVSAHTHAPPTISTQSPSPVPPLPPQTAGPSRPPLPSIPHSPASRTIALNANRDPVPSPSKQDGLAEFEKAFPSLSEFGKQWGGEEDGVSGLPNGTNEHIDPGSSSGLPNGHGKYTQRHATIHEDENGTTDLRLPDVPSFPTLPSAPTYRPGLPAPPSRPDGLSVSPPDIARISSPPAPDPGAGLQRPASTPNVATLPGDVDLISDEPVLEGKRDAHPSREPKPAVPPPSRSPVPNGITRDSRSATMSFPVAVPTPPPGASSKPREAPPPSQTVLTPTFTKPKFPFSNAIDPDTLRSYFLNPAVEMLLLDVRSEEEFQRGYVGREYEPRGAKVNVVWMDPTVLLREGMTSTKLEDSLSLSPEAQRRAFETRHKFDLVIVYDSHSANWPRKGSPPTPVSRLWDMIYEHEFAKKLERNPVMLTGGYEAWREFIKMRAAKHAKAHAQAQAQGHPSGHGHSQSLSQVNGGGARPYNPKVANGYTPPTTAMSPRQPDRMMSPSSSSADFSNKRANRDMPIYQSSQYAKNITESFGYGPQSMTGEPSSYTGHQPSRSYVPSPAPSHSHNHSQSSSYSSQTTIAPPPQASIHPGPGARRRSDYVEQHGQSYSGYPAAASPVTSPPPHSSTRPAIDYPQAHALGVAARVPQPPPAVVTPLERYDTRPAVVRSGSIRGLDLVAREGDEVRYWNDVVLGLTGLKNLGNTCYMNSTLQCLSATYPFTSFFLDGSYKRSINVYNPLGTKGNLANAFAELLKALWKEDYTFLSPVTFRKNIITFAQQFSGTDQHDSQEFLSFVLDGLHEDLNRVKHKPPPVEMTPEREAALETLPPEVASQKEWDIYKMRNDSFIVDLFQGQYRNRLECLTCHKTSTTYDTFMYMSLPVPAGKTKVVVQELIDEFVKSEVMEHEDAWNCPRCKVPRRASKTLTISRLPPVLLIQLKRFTTQNGVFWDKSETPVIFPVKGLDLTRYVPYRHPTGKEDLDDPRTQIGPFRYDLYGVSNHMGTLSSGHYTAYVKSSKGWMYCEDSRISKAQERDVVSRPAYILFYKRIRV